jgi:CRISPR-associated protein Cmr5
MTQVTLTREQQRAQHALQSVNQVQERLTNAGSNEKEQKKAKKFRDEYKSYAESLPANIVMNGLGQACAMLLAQAKGKSADQDAHRLLYDHLQDWLRGREHAAVYPKDQDLVKSVINHGQREYVRAQFESLAYLNWLKKFAQAYLAGEEN